MLVNSALLLIVKLVVLILQDVIGVLGHILGFLMLQVFAICAINNHAIIVPQQILHNVSNV